MGRMYLEHLQGRVFSCRLCGTHLASNMDLISKVRVEDLVSVLSENVWLAVGTLVAHQFRVGVVPQSFHSRQGKAYLFNEVVNISEGPKEERLMTTGESQRS